MVAAQNTQRFVKVIDSQLQDEHQPVTCKWLAYELGVPSHVAQKMLAAYLKFNTVDAKLKPDAGFTVTLSITGEQDGADSKTAVVRLATLDRIAEVEKELSKIHSVNVYGLQPCETKDRDIDLWLVDRKVARDATENEGECGENFRSNRFSSVHLNGITVQKKEYLPMPVRGGVDSKSSAKSSAKATVPKDKLVSSANFFGARKAKAPSKKTSSSSSRSTKSSAKKTSATKSTNEGKGKSSSQKLNFSTKRKEPSATSAPVKEGALTPPEAKESPEPMSSKESAKPDTKVSDDKTSQEGNDDDGEETFEIDDDESELRESATANTNKKVKVHASEAIKASESTKASKVDAKEEVNADDQASEEKEAMRKKAKKMMMVIESDSEDEEAEKERLVRAKEVAEVKAQRAKERKEAARKRKEEKKLEAEERKRQASLEQKDRFMSTLGLKNSESDPNKVRTKRVLKQVTYEDEKGYLVTKDVYEDVPLTEEEIKAEREEYERKAKLAESAANKRPASQSSTSSSAKVPPQKKTKQTSMLSFFKRGGT